MALLRTVGLYWKQNDLAENAREIHLQADELHKRVSVFVTHFGGIGKHLSQAQDAFNKAVGSYESRVLPAGRQLEAMNATREKLPEIQQVEQSVRTLTTGVTSEENDSES